LVWKNGLALAFLELLYVLHVCKLYNFFSLVCIHF
jgi:hypothetical protein